MKVRRIVGAPWRGLKQLTQMLFSRQSGVLRFLLPRTSFDYAREVGDGSGSSTVMAPLHWIARNYPEAPIKVQRELEDGELEDVPKHDMLRLLARPNPYYSGTTLWMATVMDWFIDGNAYWIKVRDRGGRVTQLWWTPSYLMEPKGDEQTFITHYEYRPDGRQVALEPSEVVHLRYSMDPDDPRRGRSPLKSVLREVFSDDEAANMTAALLRNGGVPGIVLAPKEGTPSADDVAATKAYVQERTTGDRRGEPLVMSGPTEVIKVSWSPAEMDLRNLRRIPEERVTAVLGVPAIVAGLGAGLDRSTFANFAEAREAGYEECIVPAQRIHDEELRFQLLPDFEGDPWAFRVTRDYSQVRVLQEDEDKRVNRLDVGIRGGWVRVAEGRRALGLETTDADEVYLRSFSQIEIPADGERPPELDPRRPAPEPEGEPQEAAAEDEEAAAEDGQEPQEGEDGQEKGKARVKASRRHTRLLVALERDLRALSAAFADELEEAFEELGELAAEAFRQEVSEAELARAEGKAESPSDDQLARRVVGAMSIGSWVDGKLRARFEGHYGRSAKRTLRTINAVLELGLELSDELERRIIREGGTRAGLVDVEQGTRAALARAIAAGRDAGENPLDIARRIREEVPAGRFRNAGPSYRAELIARTETKHAQNVSSLQAYRDAENVQALVVYDGRLPGSDEECQARDGDVVDFAEAEQLLAEEHPNGTLSFAPYVP